MIEQLEGFTDDILAIRISGKVTVDDYRDRLIPAALDKMARHKSLKIYCEIGEDFASYTAGAAWEDLKMGINHWGDFGKAAIVTDSGGIRTAVTLFAPFFHHPIHLYSNAQAAAGKSWITTS